MPDDAAAPSDAAGDVAAGWAAACAAALAVWAGLPGVAPDASGADGAGEAVLAVLPATPVSAVLAAAACLAGSGARSDAVAPLCDPGVLFDAGLAAVEAVAWPVFCAGAVAVDLAVAPSCAFADAPAARVAAPPGARGRHRSAVHRA